MAMLETHTSKAEDDFSLNDTKSNAVLPLCCMLPRSATGRVANSIGESKRRARLAGLQQLLACCLMVLATFNGHTFGWAFFLPHIRKELQLSRSSVSVMWSTGLFLAATVLPRVGKVLDARGQFRVVLVVTPVFALAVGSVSAINSWFMLALAFFFLRLLGPGIIVLSGTTTVAKWFKLYRGKASLVVVAFSFLMIVAQKLVSTLINSFGWRGAFIALGIIVFVLLIIVLVFLRDDPSAYNVHPDFGFGNHTAEIEASTKVVTAASSQTRDEYTMLSYKESITTSLFWALIFAQSSVEFAWCGIQFYLIDILKTSAAEITTDDIANVQVVGSLFTMLVVVCVGAYIDRISAPILKYVMLVPLVCGIIAILLLQYGTTFGHMCLYSMLLGAGMGINDLVTGVAYSNIFSKKEIARKLSIQLTLTHLFVGAGPLYCGMIRDFSSDYTFILSSFIVFKFVCGTLIIIAPFPGSTEQR